MKYISRLAYVAALPILVTTALLWILIEETSEDLISFDGFDGMHLER